MPKEGCFVKLSALPPPQARSVKNPPLSTSGRELCWCSCCRKDPSHTEKLSLSIHKKKLNGSSHMEQHLDETVLQISHFNCFTHLPYFPLKRAQSGKCSANANDKSHFSSK